jgi:hypothetical protein
MKQELRIHVERVVRHLHASTKLALVALAGGDGAILIREATHWSWRVPAIALIFVIGVQMFEHERSRAADWETLELG